MSDIIKLVQGDDLPRLQITLTDRNTGSAIDLSAGTTTVAVHFRQTGSDTVVVIPCVKVGSGATGQVYMDWSTGALGGNPGNYEGAIVISFNGLKQTVYDVMRFSTRASF